MEIDRPDPRRITGGRLRHREPVVLVVDDSEDNRDLYAIALGRAGYRVALACDGIDAVEKAKLVSPAVILMDLAMPHLDGWEATRRIRELPELGDGPRIFALTAFTDAVSIQRALAAGCDAVLAKPCPPAELLARLAEATAAPRHENDRETA